MLMVGCCLSQATKGKKITRLEPQKTESPKQRTGLHFSHRAPYLSREHPLQNMGEGHLGFKAFLCVGKQGVNVRSLNIHIKMYVSDISRP